MHSFIWPDIQRCLYITLHSTVFRSFVLATAMAHSVKLFLFIQKSFKEIGVRPSQHHRGLSFNSRNALFLFCYAQMFLSVLAFFIIKANTMLEYGNSFFMFETQFKIAMEFLVLMWRITDILDWLKNLKSSLKQVTNQICNALNIYFVWMIICYFHRIAHHERCTHKI